MLKRFIAYYKPHKFMFALDMLASLLISIIGMVYPMVTNKMLNDLIPNKLYNQIIIAGLTVLGLYIIRMLLNYFVQYYGHVIGVKMQKQMRSDLFAHLERLPYSFFDNHETGAILTRLTSDLFEVSELAHHGPENLFICAVMIIGSFAYLCTIDVYLTLIIFACVPVLVLVSMITRKRMREAFTDRRRSNAVINAALESSITGIRVTKAFTNADKEVVKFEVGNGQFVEASRKSYKAMGQFHSSTAFVTDVFNVIILIAGGLFLYNGRINFADYSTFIVSVNLFINPVNTLIGFVEQYQNGTTGFKRFLEIMDVEPEQEDPEAKPLENVQGSIDLENVSFSYAGRMDKLCLTVTSSRPNDTLVGCIDRWISLAEKGDHKALMVDTAEKMYTEAYMRKNSWMFGIIGSFGKPKSYARFYTMADACRTHDAFSYLDRITAPTLVIGGMQDITLTGEASEEIDGQIPGAQLYLYPEYGHSLYEEAKDVNGRLLDFLG